MKKLLLTLAALATAAGLAAVGVIYGGLYDVAATTPHLAATYRLLDVALRRSVKRRAESVAVPPLDDKAMQRRGLVLFKAHCVQCHGAPGVAPEPFALGLEPAAANLVHTARHWSPAEIYWAVENGIKMTGMPAWKFRMGEDDLWAVVAFIRTLPRLSPEDYRRLASSAEEHDHVHGHPQAARAPEAPDASRGEMALRQYACVTCHRIPGVVGPNAPVGPPLDRIGSRKFIAGVLSNTPGNLERWLRHPQAISPSTAMPDLGVTARDARDIAAYLSTLR